MPHRIIPIVKAETLIPRGEHCYPPDSEDPAAPVKVCPFWEVRSGGFYCRYLEKLDRMDDESLRLWELVKACGVKTDEILW